MILEDLMLIKLILDGMIKKNKWIQFLVKNIVKPILDKFYINLEI